MSTLRQYGSVIPKEALMRTLEIDLFSCLSDNFGVLLHDTVSGATACIDAPEEQPILEACARRGWTLTHIFTTHHHADHVQANLALKARFNLTICGPAKEADRIAGIDVPVGEGSVLDFAGHRIEVIETPGHTLGHVCYYMPQDGLLFSADTLFAMGCGRLFEAPAATMWPSLQKLMALPDDTIVYFGHEYTASNARFALTVDPDNQALKDRAEAVSILRANGQFTAPTTIGLEKATNPYFRVGDAGIRRRLGLETATDTEVFAAIRLAKDNFK
jgi:hydroxyacylglutathione hydrolase